MTFNSSLRTVLTILCLSKSAFPSNFGETITALNLAPHPSEISSMSQDLITRQTLDSTLAKVETAVSKWTL